MKTQKLLIAVSLISSCYSHQLNAQIAGDLDTNFGVSGYALTDVVPGVSEVYYDMVVLSDDSYYLIGNSDGSNRNILIAKFDADGALDTQFGSSGYTSIDLSLGAHEDARSATLLWDGKLLITGRTYVGSDYNGYLLRINADGTVDNTFGSGQSGWTSFNTGAGTRAIGIEVEVLADNNILVAATVKANNNTNDIGLFKFTTGGALYQSFGINNNGSATYDFTDQNENVEALAIDASGMILVAGSTQSDTDDGFIARFSANGEIDLTFNTIGSWVYSQSDINRIKDLYATADGKIFATGYSGSGNNYDGIIVKLNNDGTADTGFSSDGLQISDIGTANGLYLSSLMVLADGHIVVGGSISGLSMQRAYVLMLQADGTPESEFSAGGDVTISFPQTLTVIQGLGMGMQSDGGILLTGVVAGQDFTGFNLYTLKIFSEDAVNGIAEQTQRDVLVYPNPVANVFSIALTNEASIQKVELINLTGQVVDTWEPMLEYTLGNTIAAGKYILRIETNNYLYFNPIVVE